MSLYNSVQSMQALVADHDKLVRVSHFQGWLVAIVLIFLVLLYLKVLHDSASPGAPKAPVEQSLTVTVKLEDTRTVRQQEPRIEVRRWRSKNAFAKGSAERFVACQDEVLRIVETSNELDESSSSSELGLSKTAVTLSYWFDPEDQTSSPARLSDYVSNTADLLFAIVQIGHDADMYRNATPRANNMVLAQQRAGEISKILSCACDSESTACQEGILCIDSIVVVAGGASTNTDSDESEKCQDRAAEITTIGRVKNVEF